MADLGAKRVSIDFASKKLGVMVPEHSAADVQMAVSSRTGLSAPSALIFLALDVYVRQYVPD